MPGPFLIDNLDAVTGFFDLSVREGEAPSGNLLQLSAIIKESVNTIRQTRAIEPPRDILDRLRSDAQKFLVDGEGDVDRAITDLQSFLRNASAPRREDEPATDAEQTGAFDVSIDDAKAQLIFTQRDRRSPISTLQQEFMFDVIRTNRRLLVLLRGTRTQSTAAAGNDPRELALRMYLEKLRGVAQVGLSQRFVQIPVARAALRELEFDLFAIEGSRVKWSYLRTLGIRSAQFSVAFAVLYFAGNYWACPCLVDGLPQGHCVADERWSSICGLRKLAIMLVGTSIGVWLSFAVRRVASNLDDLVQLRSDPMRPAVRVLFVLLLALTASLVLLTQMITIEIGEFKTTMLLSSGRTALLTGVFFGLGEQALPLAIAKRADEFISSLSGSSR